MRNDAFLGRNVAIIARIFDQQTVLTCNFIASVSRQEQGAFARKHWPDNQIQAAIHFYCIHLLCLAGSKNEVRLFFFDFYGPLPSERSEQGGATLCGSLVFGPAPRTRPQNKKTLARKTTAAPKSEAAVVRSCA
jgi:hypothetical protein